jgi:hypothetical protein
MKLKYNTLKQMVLEELSNGAGLLESPEVLSEKSILKNKYPFKAIFIFGPAGSGKTFLSGQLEIPDDFVVSNPDERIEDVFPTFGMSMDFRQGTFTQGAEKESSPIAKAQQTAREILQNASQGHTHNMLSIANPIVFDTTGENVKKLVKRMKNLMKVGYDVAVFQVNVPEDVSVSRDDKRKRTVGEPTKTISADYQKQVVVERGYFEALAKEPNATMLGGDIYANLFDLRDNSLLPGITDEHVASMKTKNGDPFTPKYAADLLAQARSELRAWAGAEPENPTGNTILAGMKALVKASDGVLGQNMLHFGPAAEQGIGVDNPAVAEATKLIADMGGVEAPLRGSQRGRKPAGEKFGVDGKDGKDPSIRDLAADAPVNERRLTAKIERVIWEMMKNGSS